MKKGIIVLVIILVISALIVINLVYNHRINELEVTISNTQMVLDEISYQNHLLQEDMGSLSESFDDLKLGYKDLSSDNNAMTEQIEEKVQMSGDLTLEIEGLSEALSDLKEEMMYDHLADSWHSIWDGIYQSGSGLSQVQKDEVNLLLAPVLKAHNVFRVNPIGCFFTSTYEDIKDINLSEFLGYFPYGEIPKELPEFEELQKLENWPFGTELEDEVLLPVPIHRYERKDVEEVFMTYTGLSLKDLSDFKRKNELQFLDSTDAFYNYTSDFGPGGFTCTKGVFEEGVLKLYGTARGVDAVLTIIKEDDRYVIKSLVAE